MSKFYSLLLTLFIKAVEGQYQNLNDQAKEMTPYYKPSSLSEKIYGNGGYFDALSFFIELHKNEEQRTFAPIAKTDGFKQLDDKQLADYNEKLKNHASFVLKRFNLNARELYEFLIYLLRRRANYRENERVKLAEALGKDAVFLADLIHWATGQSFKKIEDTIGKQAGFWEQQQFRHLDKTLEIYDHARGTFERLMSKYNEAFPGFDISATDLDSLLKFLQDKNLFIIPYAIFDIDEVLNKSNRFQRTSLYIGLSNLATGFECFLREIALLANNIPKKIKMTDTLSPIIQNLFIEWGGTFQTEHQKRADKNLSSYQPDAISYIEDVFNDHDVNNTLTAFLIAYRARNFVAHNYTIEPYFYHHLYGIAYREICNSLFYSWKYASLKGWV